MYVYMAAEAVMPPPYFLISPSPNFPDHVFIKKRVGGIRST